VSVTAPHDAIVLDIEGTTTPISYVYDVLFPYVRRELPAYVGEYLDDVRLQPPIKWLREEWEADAARGEHPPALRENDGDREERAASIVAYAEWLMDRDRKATGLKALQGLISRRGYENGSLHGEVYPDVPVAFARWHKAGIPIAIFSSGSVVAQQNLFSTTAHGDLTRWIRHFFDTLVGPKRSPESYGRIAFGMECEPARMLFISDVVAELDAAREAGCDTRLCIRGSSGEGGQAGAGSQRSQPANGPSANGHTVVYDFNDIM
jgi:enolase-phosphatase E1